MSNKSEERERDLIRPTLDVGKYSFSRRHFHQLRQSHFNTFFEGLLHCSVSSNVVSQVSALLVYTVSQVLVVHGNSPFKNSKQALYMRYKLCIYIYLYIYKVKEVGNQLGAAKTVSTATYPRKLDSQSFRRFVTINFQISLGAMKHMDRLRLSQTVSCSVSFWAALLGVITTLAGLRIVVPQKQGRRSPGKLGSNPRGQAAPVWR